MSRRVGVIRSENHVKPIKPDDDVLLDSALKYVPKGKNSVHWDQIPDWLRAALVRQFHDVDTAKQRLQCRLRMQRFQTRWPPDWPSRVDPQPFFDKHKGTLTPKDMDWLERICAHAKKSRRCPTLNQEELARLSKYCEPSVALNLMGLPHFKRRRDRRRMEAYWDAEQADVPAEPK